MQLLIILHSSHVCTANYIQPALKVACGIIPLVFALGQCDELETSIDGGWIEISDITRTVHTTATVTCYDKYYIGGGNIICGENGNWSQSRLPQCNPGEL